jgi:hypothetical protein
MIDNIDPDLLEEQRKKLNTAYSYSNINQADGSLTLNARQVEALSGILNMLDSWSDEYFEGKGDETDA